MQQCDRLFKKDHIAMLLLLKACAKLLEGAQTHRLVLRQQHEAGCARKVSRNTCATFTTMAAMVMLQAIQIRHARTSVTRDWYAHPIS
jgi:hypothetical protein